MGYVASRDNILFPILFDLQLPAELGLLSVLASLDVSHNKRLSSLPDEMGRLSGLWEVGDVMYKTYSWIF